MKLRPSPESLFSENSKTQFLHSQNCTQLRSTASKNGPSAEPQNFRISVAKLCGKPEHRSTFSALHTCGSKKQEHQQAISVACASRKRLTWKDRVCEVSADCVPESSITPHAKGCGKLRSELDRTASRGNTSVVRLSC